MKQRSLRLLMAVFPLLLVCPSGRGRVRMQPSLEPWNGLGAFSVGPGAARVRLRVAHIPGGGDTLTGLAGRGRPPGL